MGRNLGHLEGAIATMADNLCTDLDQFLAKARERPLFNRFGGMESVRKLSPQVTGKSRWDVVGNFEAIPALPTGPLANRWKASRRGWGQIAVGATLTTWRM